METGAQIPSSHQKRWWLWRPTSNASRGQTEATDPQDRLKKPSASFQVQGEALPQQIKRHQGRHLKPASGTHVHTHIYLHMYNIYTHLYVLHMNLKKKERTENIPTFAV